MCLCPPEGQLASSTHSADIAAQKSFAFLSCDASCIVSARRAASVLHALSGNSQMRFAHLRVREQEHCPLKGQCSCDRARFCAAELHRSVLRSTGARTLRPCTCATSHVCCFAAHMLLSEHRCCFAAPVRTVARMVPLQGAPFVLP